MAQTQLAQTPSISDPLTWEQICDRYPDEWVCLVEIDTINDTDFAFRMARVVGHGKHPRDPYLQARPIRHLCECMGHHFTGRVRARNFGMVIE